MGFHKISIIILILLMLSGCRTAKDSNNSTSTMVPSLTPNMEPRANSAPHFTDTPTISRKSPTITLTRTVTIVQTPTPTTIFDRMDYEKSRSNESWNQEQTQIAEFPNNSGTSQTGDYLLLSPNGDWIIERNNNIKDTILKNKSGREIYIDGTKLDPNNLAVWSQPFKWSRDSKYLWVAYGNTTGGSMDCDIGSYYLGLFRIDLQTGKVTATLPLDKNGYVFQFSPSGRYLAFSQANSNQDEFGRYFVKISKLVILDLITGNKVEYQDPAQLSGSMLFSPDETHLAYSSQEADSPPPPDKDGYFFGCIKPKLRIISLDSGDVETFYNGTTDIEKIHNETGRAPIELLYWDKPGFIWFRFFPEEYKVLNIEKNTITSIER